MEDFRLQLEATYDLGEMDSSNSNAHLPVRETSVAPSLHAKENPYCNTWSSAQRMLTFQDCAANPVAPISAHEDRPAPSKHEAYTDNCESRNTEPHIIRPTSHHQTNYGYCQAYSYHSRMLPAPVHAPLQHNSLQGKADKQSVLQLNNNIIPIPISPIPKSPSPHSPLQSSKRQHRDPIEGKKANTNQRRKSLAVQGSGVKVEKVRARVASRARPKQRAVTGAHHYPAMSTPIHQRIASNDDTAVQRDAEGAGKRRSTRIKKRRSEGMDVSYAE